MTKKEIRLWEEIVFENMREEYKRKGEKQKEEAIREAMKRMKEIWEGEL